MPAPTTPRLPPRSDYRLRLPGPSAVPARVRQAIAGPVLNHRGPEFRAQMEHAEALLQPIFGTRNHILLFACSGTGMMEAALANVVAPGEKLLCIVSGQFGERFATIGEALGAVIETFDVPWGEAADPGAVAERVRQGDYRAVVAVHNESSTGSVADLAGLGAAVRDTPAILVVDSVSGLAGIEMQQDEWGIDILIGASQKALMCPPGIGLASVSDKAWAVVNRDDARPRFYWDFRRALASSKKCETPFTAPTSLVAGLCEALDLIHAEGLPNVLARHALLADALRAGGAAMGLPDYTRSRRSATVVVFDLPDALDGGAIVRAIYERFGTVIAGARNRLAGRVIRIGTMGHVDAGTILTDLYQLEQVLRGLGHPAEPGAGVAAATRHLAAA